MTHELLHGDCMETMATMDAGSVDAVICDPPYGLEFMGKEWDKLDGGLPQENVWKGRHGKGGGKIERDPKTAGGRHAASFGGKQQGFKRCKTCGKRQFSGSPCVCDEPDFVTEYAQRAPSASIRMQRWHEQWAIEAYRVLKPSHYLLAFGGTRTWHRLACAIEDAGFEIRDTLMWLYGSGFPKGKSCLKPAWEPVILARKPGPMRELGIEECRIGTSPGYSYPSGPGGNHFGVGQSPDGKRTAPVESPSGRWPANLILECTCDETREGTASTGTHVGRNRTGVKPASVYGKFGTIAEDTGYAGPSGQEPVRIHTDPNCPCAMLDGQTSGAIHSAGCAKTGDEWDHAFAKDAQNPTSYGQFGDRRPHRLGDSGGASRFFLNVKGDPCDANTAVTSSCPLSGLDASALSDVATLAARGASGSATVDRQATAACISTCARCTRSPNPALCATLLVNIGIIPTTESLLRSYGSAQDATAANTNSASGGVVADGSGPESGTRFLYSAKASRSERNAGCEGMEAKRSGIGALASEQGGEYLDFSHPAPDGIGEWLRAQRKAAGLTDKDVARHFPSATGGITGCVRNWEHEASRPTPQQWKLLRGVIGFDGQYDDAMTSLDHIPHATRDAVVSVKANHHPTVKPLALMRWLVKLVAQPGDVVLDPFMGSGTTGVACATEGRDFIGIEREQEYLEISRRRIEAASAQGRLKV